MKRMLLIIALVGIAILSYTFSPFPTHQGEDTAFVEPVSTSGMNDSDERGTIVRTALLANGCFWCVEHDLAKIKGVTDVISGYAGGTTENPSYENYAAGGHREVVHVTYDANVVSFANLVEHIIKHGDPTDADGSFGDRGQEYAPAIYYENDTERDTALAVIAKIDTLAVFAAPLPLVVIPQVKFWPAEEYHQDYGEKNPLRYNYYRKGSGRDVFIKERWGEDADAFTLSNTITQSSQTSMNRPTHSWESFIKPPQETLRVQLTEEQYRVTQEDSTEKPFANDYDKNYTEGVYVDVVSGEPLYLSKDKYDSGSGWPSFVKPISPETVVLKEDKKLFSTRTEVRSRYADSHLGHVFDDGPADRGGMRYCMNSAALRFIPKADMEREGYAHLLPLMNS
jgi:peptide methionine sulfoxide reductase msrA/msrB